jgi:hypothetical protein
VVVGELGYVNYTLPDSPRVAEWVWSGVDTPDRLESVGPWAADVPDHNQRLIQTVVLIWERFRASQPPDPEEWRREATPPPSLRWCPTCKQETWHGAYSHIKNRKIGEYAVSWFCSGCGDNNGTR